MILLLLVYCRSFSSCSSGVIMIVNGYTLHYFTSILIDVVIVDCTASLYSLYQKTFIIFEFKDQSHVEVEVARVTMRLSNLFLFSHLP